MIREIPRQALNGILALLLLAVATLGAAAMVITGAKQEDPVQALSGALAVIVRLTAV